MMRVGHKNLLSKTQFQQGFALASVLIVLLILAMIVAALLSNQKLALRETSDILASATRAQESHNLHRTCLKLVREQMSASTLRVNSAMVDWRNAFDISANGVSGTCELEAITAGAPQQWTPHLRITTRLNGQVEISDWRYEPCLPTTPAEACLSNVQTQLMVKKLGEVGFQTLTPIYLLNVPVQTVWRKE